MKLKTIVVGFDDTDPARRALERAADLAEAFGAKLVVTSVAPILVGAGRSAGPTDPIDSPQEHREQLKDARELLEEYHWPGNVREMRNLMERAVVLVSGDTITAADLNPWLETPPDEGEDAGLKGKVARSEIDSIRRALEAADWNVTQAAAGLGIDRTNLHRKMRKYGIARR